MSPLEDQKVYLREAKSIDVILIEKWLQNPNDCKMAIGHAPLIDRDFAEWLNAEDQACWILR